MKYYFVSYSYAGPRGYGWGRSWMSVQGKYLNIKKAEQWLKNNDRDMNALAITFYKKVSKAEWAENNKEA